MLDTSGPGGALPPRHRVEPAFPTEDFPHESAGDVETGTGGIVAYPY